VWIRYNMDETGVMLSMLGSVKVLVGRGDVRGHRGAGVKQIMVLGHNGCDFGRGLAQAARQLL
jgi:hypothetical protein